METQFSMVNLEELQRLFPITPLSQLEATFLQTGDESLSVLLNIGATLSVLNPTALSACLPQSSNAVQILGIYIFFFSSFVFFRATPAAAYGDSQAKGLIRATAASLHNSHCNARSDHVCKLANYTTGHSNTRSLTH